MHAFGLHDFLQRLAFALRSRQGTRPHITQQALHGSVGTGHGVGERVVGIAGVAVQARLFVAQAQDVTRHLAVVVLAALFAAADPGAPGFLAQVAPLRKRQERHHQRTRQRHHVAGPAALAGGLPRRGPHKARQTGEVDFVVQQQLPDRLVVQHVLRESRGQPGQFFHHQGIARPVGWRHAGTSAHKVQVDALQHAQRFGRQAEFGALAVQGIDPCKQCLVHEDGTAMGSHRRGHGSLHRLQGRAGSRRRQVVEHRRHALQQPAGAIEGGHGVVEAGRLGIRGNGAQLVALLAHGLTQSRLEVLGQQGRERRQAVGRRPGLKQGVGQRHVGGTHHFSFLMAVSSSSR